MADESETLRGTVKWFNGPKGYGFITPDDGSQDLFVHQTSIQSDGFRTLYESQRIEFKVKVDEDGRPKAVDVVPLKGSSNRGGYGTRGGYGGRYGGYGGRRGGRVGGNGGGVECYNCGGLGHLARDCYQGGGGGSQGYGYGGGSGRGGRFNDGGYGRGFEGHGGRGGREGEYGVYNRGRANRGGLYSDGGYGRGGGISRRGNYDGSGGGGGSGGTCFNCGEPGHFARECPNVQN